MVRLKSVTWLLAFAVPVTALPPAPLPTAPQTLRAEPPPPQLRAIFAHCDADGNAALSWVEFENCWRQLRAGRLRTQLVPARDLDSVTLGELWREIRAGGSALRPHDALGREVVAFIDEAERGFIETQGKLTLRDWLKKPA